MQPATATCGECADDEANADAERKHRGSRNAQERTPAIKREKRDKRGDRGENNSGGGDGDGGGGGDWDSGGSVPAVIDPQLRELVGRAAGVRAWFTTSTSPMA